MLFVSFRLALLNKKIVKDESLKTFSPKLQISLLMTNNGGIIWFFAINENLHYGPIRCIRSAWVVSFFREVVVKVFF